MNWNEIEEKFGKNPDGTVCESAARTIRLAKYLEKQQREYNMSQECSDGCRKNYNPNIQCEYGGSIRFAECKMIGSDGKETDIPTCEACGIGKTLIIGLDSHAFICGNGCVNEVCQEN